MANVFANMTNQIGILKNFYQGPIVSQFNDELPLYREIEKGREKFNGIQVIRPLKVARNNGIGATSDGGALPSIGYQNVQQAQIVAKFNYLRFGITGPQLKSSMGDKGSFVSSMEYEMEQGLTDLKNDINRQLFWNGDGTLANVAATVVASTSITATGRTSSEDGSKYLAAGMVIDIYSSAGALKASSVGITSVSGSTTATLVLDTAVSVAATDIIVRAGAYNNEVQGLRTTLDGLTTTIYNISRSSYPVFQGNVVSGSSGQLTLDLMQQAYNLARQKGGAKCDAVYCDFASERYYNKLLVADKRYVGKVKGDGTFSDKSQSYLEWAGVPVVPDKDCPTEIYFLDSKNWRRYTLCELEWADESGAYMIAQTSTDALEARLRLFFNLFCEKPSAQARLHTYISP